MTITIVETRQFSTRIRALGLESELHAVQVSLAQNPERGALDPGGVARARTMSDPARRGQRGGLVYVGEPAGDAGACTNE